MGIISLYSAPVSGIEQEAREYYGLDDRGIVVRLPVEARNLCYILYKPSV